MTRAQSTSIVSRLRTQFDRQLQVGFALLCLLSPSRVRAQEESSEPDTLSEFSSEMPKDVAEADSASVSADGAESCRCPSQSALS